MIIRPSPVVSTKLPYRRSLTCARPPSSMRATRVTSFACAMEEEFYEFAPFSAARVAGLDRSESACADLRGRQTFPHRRFSESPGREQRGRDAEKLRRCAARQKLPLRARRLDLRPSGRIASRHGLSTRFSAGAGNRRRILSGQFGYDPICKSRLGFFPSRRAANALAEN